VKLSKLWKDALELALMQYLTYGICTVSWRAIAQANVLAAVITDTMLGTLTFFVFRKIADSSKDQLIVPWLGYTVGGAAGTVCGIYASIWWLGK
jgi:hypothetical protein